MILFQSSDENLIDFLMQNVMVGVQLEVVQQRIVQSIFKQVFVHFFRENRKCCR